MKQIETPLFATWKKSSQDHLRSHGCIGTFDAKLLNNGFHPSL